MSTLTPTRVATDTYVERTVVSEGQLVCHRFALMWEGATLGSAEIELPADTPLAQVEQCGMSALLRSVTH